MGKSTLIRSRFPEAKYIDLLDSRIYQKLLTDPGMLEEMIPPDWQEGIILDEVQRVPELLNEVHRLIENKHWRFILTGSSARKLRRQGVNLLAGRARTYRLHSLTAKELGNKFELEIALKYGMLPTVHNLQTAQERERYLYAYVETYLQEEIMQEGLTRNLANSARFLQIASMSVGGVLNVSAVARESMVERKVVENYFGILEDLMLGVRVPVFRKRAKRELIAKSKFYLFDTGVYQTLKPKGVLDTESEVSGAGLENLFLQNLLAEVANSVKPFKVRYYRTVGGSEVDFVVYGDQGLWAFEIKNGRKFRREWLRGLKRFGQDYPEAKRYVLYTGKEHLYMGKIEVVPIEEFLRGKLADVLGVKR